jgi:GDPmannose 4,6-dehydratase
MIKKNIIISGALGQNGIILTNFLIKDGYNVIGIVKKLPAKKIKNTYYLNINLNSQNKINQLIASFKPIAFVHLGSSNPNYKEIRNKDYYNINYSITKNLINCFAKLTKCKLILIGSSQMYSSKKNNINLYSRFKYNNSYANFRIDSYKYMKKIKNKFNSNMTMAILFNHDSIYRNKKFLIPRIIKMIKNNKKNQLNKIYQENISGDFSHAEDICIGLKKLIFSKKNPDKLIFSSNERTFINDIINFLIKKKNWKFNTSKKNNKLPTGNNNLTRKILNWRLKKNTLIAVKEINSIVNKENY